MRNPALLAASLAGRPLLMRADAIPAYAQLLGVEASRANERRSPFAIVLGRARQLIRAEADSEEPPPAEPMAYLPRWMGEPDAMGFGWSLKEGVAVIKVDGPLLAEGFGYGDCWWHGYDTLMQAAEEVYSDARVRGVFFVKNSPGGVCAPGLRELADFIRANRAAAGGKPTWSFCEGSYSADYWLTSQSDQVVAPREGGVGSIGAVMTHCDASGMLSQDGIVYTPIQFGAKKTDGAWFKPLSDTAKADMQAEVDQFGRWFVQGVMDGRPSLTEEAILATQAGLFLGDSDVKALSGLAQGFVDQVMTEREAFAALRDLVNGATSPAAPAATASTMEFDMKRSRMLAAIQGAGLSAEDITKVDAALIKAAKDDQEDEYDDGSDEDEENDDDNTEDKPRAEGEGGEAGEGGEGGEGGSSDDSGNDGDGDEGEGGEGDAPEATKPDGQTVLAILDLPEAKGREKLARKLAEQPGMTASSAKAILAAAPKASALRPEDPPISATAGGGEPKNEFEAGQAVAARFKQLTGGQRARR